MPVPSPETGRERLRSAGRKIRFERGTHLVNAGDRSTFVLLIESGLMKVVIHARDGVASVSGLVGRGDLAGELGVINDAGRSAQITALTPGTAVVVPAAGFLRLRDEDPDVRALIDLVWRRRQERIDARSLALARDVHSRVSILLLEWAREHGTPERGGLRLRGPSQRDVALAVAASDKSVEEALARLRAAGLVCTSRLSFHLPDPEAIAALVAGRRTDSSLVPDFRE